jgi:hypothetical protein
VARACWELPGKKASRSCDAWHVWTRTMGISDADGPETRMTSAVHSAEPLGAGFGAPAQLLEVLAALPPLFEWNDLHRAIGVPLHSS